MISISGKRHGGNAILHRFWKTTGIHEVSTGGPDGAGAAIGSGLPILRLMKK
jgi:hypothetical protein